MASILLLGLDDQLAEPLAKALRRLQHQVRATNSIAAALRDADAELLFVNGDTSGYRDVLRELVERRPDLPVVIVDRIPEYHRWINALELGAADYCCAPFEAAQVSWTVDGVLRWHTAPKAAAKALV